MSRIFLSILLTIVLQSFVFAEQYYCNVNAHGYGCEDGYLNSRKSDWKNYPNNVFIVNVSLKNKTIKVLDTMIDLDDTYYIIKEDENTIIALLEDSHSFSVANVSTIVFYKDISYLISTNVNDLGITINQGGCYNY